MKQRKFRSQAAANKMCPNGWKARKGKAAKLKDGTKANIYSFVRVAKKHAGQQGPYRRSKK